jgi:dynein intermediate chain 1
VVQWNIYDSYTEDFERVKREKEKEALKEKKPALQKQVELKRTDSKGKAQEEYNRRYFQKCQVLERMVNQNIFDEIAHGEENFYSIVNPLKVTYD